MDNQNQLSPVRQLPVWKSSDKIVLNGLEWEAIFNFINNTQDAFMAMNNVMNRHVIEGTIKMKFQKLSGTEYVDMTPEEEAPYQKEFQDMLQQAHELAADAVAKNQEKDLAQSQKDVPSLAKLVGGNEESLLVN